MPEQAMTDQELSKTLREWKSTPAPETLDDRVFARRVPTPWWERLPGTPVAAFGALAGVLIVWSLTVLAPRDAPKPAPQPTPAPAVAAPIEPPTPITPPRPKAVRPKSVPTKSAPVNPAQPQLLMRVDPQFPADAPPALMSSTLKLYIHVGKDGHVIEAIPIGGEPALYAVAIEAVRQWLYAPEFQNGVPVEAYYEINVSFQPRPAKR
ncbi:MAG: energy transducer TonB [Bryobacteraceae bacterium]